MSRDRSSRTIAGDIYSGTVRGPDLCGPGEREESCDKYPEFTAMDAGGLAALRFKNAQRVERALLALILAAHEVNRWDLTGEAVDDLCDAALVYAYALEKEREDCHG